MKRNVSKMLSSEEKTILANIKSLVAQLEAMEQGPGGSSPNRPAHTVERAQTEKRRKEASMDLQAIKQKMMAGEELSAEEKLTVIESLPKGTDKAMPVEDDPFDEEDITMQKANASDDAEDRVGENQEETTGPAVNEVGDNMKQIANAIAEQVVKSVTKSVDGRLKKIEDTMGSHGDAITGILEGLGVVEKATDEEKPETKEIKKSRPVANLDAEQVLELIRKSSGTPQESDANGTGLVESFSVRKSTAGAGKRGDLAAAMGAVFGVNSDQNGRF